MSHQIGVAVSNAIQQVGNFNRKGILANLAVFCGIRMSFYSRMYWVLENVKYALQSAQ